MKNGNKGVGNKNERDLRHKTGSGVCVYGVDEGKNKVRGVERRGGIVKVAGNMMVRVRVQSVKTGR